MAEYDKSLDDIIKQRKIGKGSTNKNVVVKAGAKPSPKNVKANVAVGGRVAGRLGNNNKKQQFDARSKIGTWKQKPSWTGGAATGAARRLPDARDKLPPRDARDKLNQIAQRSDARDRLNLIARRSDARQTLNRLGAQHQQQRLPHLLGQRVGAHQLGIPAPNPNQLTRTVPNQNRYLTPFMEPPKPLSRPLSNLMDRPVGMPLSSTQKHVLMTRNGIQIIQKQPLLPTRAPPSAPPSSLFSRTFSSLAKSVGSSEFSRRPSAALPVLKRKYDDDDGYSAQTQRPSFDSQANKRFMEQLAMSPTRSAPQALPPSMNAKLQSRLGPGGESVSPLQGYKVLVTNLRSIVSQHDILELFGDLGPLRRAQFLRQGVAEVVYVKLADAQKAVDSYHNRELDGQPMSCKLVNSGPPLQAEHQMIGYGNRVGTMHSDRISSSAKSRVVPDANVIHRALFHGATPPGAAPRASITVTM